MLTCKYVHVYMGLVIELVDGMFGHFSLHVNLTLPFLTNVEKWHSYRSTWMFLLVNKMGGLHMHWDVMVPHGGLHW